MALPLENARIIMLRISPLISVSLLGEAMEMSGKGQHLFALLSCFSVLFVVAFVPMPDSR